MLVIFIGLPGNGKSTLWQGVATELTSVYIRVDTVEQTLKNEDFKNVIGEGYAIAYRLAAHKISLNSTS